MRLSKTLIAAIKLDNRKDYLIAHEAGLHPSTLSRMLNGGEKIKPRDERVLRLSRVLGICEDSLFEGEHAEQTSY